VSSGSKLAPSRDLEAIEVLLKRAGAAALFGLAVAFPPFAIAVLPDGEYWVHVYVWVLFFAFASAAWNLIGGFARQYSFGHAGFLGLGAYVSTLLYLNAGVSPWLGMLAGGVVAAAVGAVIGYPCFRLRGAFFALVTIAFTEMARTAFELTDFIFGLEINGSRGVVIPPVGQNFWAFQFLHRIDYAYAILALLAAVLLVCWVVKRSRLGYYLAALGDDEEAVASLGTSPAKAKLYALLLSAFFTAIAGSFYAQLILFITPTRTMSLELSVQMVIMAVLGGLGSVTGPLLGALVVVPIAELTRGYLGGSFQGVHLIVYGALLMAVILFMPEGIAGWARPHVNALMRRIALRIAPKAVRAGPAFGNAPVIELPQGAMLHSRPGDARPVLALERASRSFGGAIGVKNLSLTVGPGEVVGLIGPNGAGKTTVFNLVTGFLATQTGRMRFGGADLAGLAPQQINRLGIARTFQIVRPFPSLTAAENVMVAALPRVDSVVAARREAERCLSFVGLAHRADTIADGLSTGERKRLELARALATRPQLLLMDEVTGGLDQRSLPGMIALVEKIKGEGLSILIIEHNLRVISRLCDRVVMLHLGETLCEGTAQEVLADPRVIDVYIGGKGARG
jgi:branched-chain amino acid transport system permease protein